MRCRVIGLEHVGVTDVSRDQRTGLARDPGGDLERRAVEQLDVPFAADRAELLAMAVVGERLDDVRSGGDELSMEGDDRLGSVEHDLGHERAGLDVAATLELEEVALGADHRAVGQTFS